MVKKSDKSLRAKGKTPPGTHIPVLLDEVMAVLGPQPGQIVADCTIGYGAHAEAFLQRIGPTGRLIGLDLDGVQFEKTRRRLSKIDVPMSLHHGNFAEIPKILKHENLTCCDIIFADLGVSSMQIDDPERPISYKNDGLLDMRMDTTLPKTGADLLMTLSAEELSRALWELSDEPDHQRIAEWIVAQRGAEPITQTSQLVRLVFNAKGITPRTWKKQQKNSRFGALHPAGRTFQTLRILVNDEINSLKKLLENAPQCLRPAGKIGIISFHSTEDRLVKNSFRNGLRDGTYQAISKRVITPKTREIVSNPRSKSAKFRWAQKTPA